MLEQQEYMERVVTTGQNYAYLKIGEGCSNFVHIVLSHI